MKIADFIKKYLVFASQPKHVSYKIFVGILPEFRNSPEIFTANILARMAWIFDYK